MSGYLQRLANAAKAHRRSIHPLAGSLFAAPKSDLLTPPYEEQEETADTLNLAPFQPGTNAVDQELPASLSPQTSPSPTLVTEPVLEPASQSASMRRPNRPQQPQPKPAPYFEPPQLLVPEIQPSIDQQRTEGTSAVLPPSGFTPPILSPRVVPAPVIPDNETIRDGQHEAPRAKLQKEVQSRATTPAPAFVPLPSSSLIRDELPHIQPASTRSTPVIETKGLLTLRSIFRGFLRPIHSLAAALDCFRHAVSLLESTPRRM